MDDENIWQIVAEICRDEELSKNKLDSLRDRLSPWEPSVIQKRLESAGVIPEMYDHDSAEEKLYAKYCELLVSESFKKMGFRSDVIETTIDRADIWLEITGEGARSKAVGDVKAFRLSRTALNPKDYKIEALHKWREPEKADYAFIVAPHTQFPGDKSRLYQEAITYNVTLISFAHIELMLKTALERGISLDMYPLWNIGKTIPSGSSGNSYWSMIDTTVTEICNSTPDSIILYKDKYLKKIRHLANDQIKFGEERIADIRSMDREKLIDKVIAAEGINGKIQILRKYLA
ncbi:MAG TPA: HindIII family type II restriction endonuclease [Oscillatoriaceae cyanobacterium M33_DOE_052]|uniref:HindIII family type II restriction endonuclease n=1 Tax=Planktothricoides sp. SpSt-374 TaxID=2282167 RepID=A0A7C3VNU4_9CYAN|nr:HindIII family type II restriction endonuclease [Oscillatoriaceae cyanobacterium M33_DOE_052]